MKQKTYAIADIPKKYREVVDDVSDERFCGDGIWIYLRTGYHNPLKDGAKPGELSEEEYCHIIHRDTWKQALADLQHVEQTNAING